MSGKTILLPPPPLDQTVCSAHDISVVSLNQSIRGQGRVFTRIYDFSTTINAGARSSLINITGVLYSSICIVGLAVSSEANTNWRFKFYRSDTGVVSTYANNTFCGQLEVTGLTANVNTVYEGDVEAELYYEDRDRTNEIHVIAENIGATTSKVYITILYVQAD